MAISRPFLLALLGAILVGATFFAVQGSRDSSDDAAAPVAQAAREQQAAQPAEQAPPADPEELLQSAFQGGAIDSTAFTATMSLSAEGQRVSLDLSGAYERGAANDVPEFEVNAQLNARGERVEGGFVSLGDEAYFAQGETGWRVPDDVWSPLVDAVAKPGAGAPQSLPLSLDPRRWVRSIESKGTETLDGVETTRVSASVYPRRVVRDALAAARATGQSLPGGEAVTGTVKSAELEAWVGTDDRVLRRLYADVAFAQRGEMSFELELTGVNRPQEIEAPADIRDGLPSGIFGQFAKGLVTGLSGVTGGEPVSLAALTTTNPRKAARAMAEGKKIVILFHNPDGLDDRAMRRVVRQIDARTGAVVLSDPVDAVERYGKMVEDLGVSQTPAVVLIDRTGQARLIEGYTDTETLAQAVADAR